MAFGIRRPARPGLFENAFAARALPENGGEDAKMGDAQGAVVPFLSDSPAVLGMTVLNAEGASVPFSLQETGRFESGGYAYYPDSLLFRAGRYDAIRFEATPEDLESMAARWQPVKGNIEHKRFLAGRAGEIVKAWTTEAGKALRGVVRIPLGLDTLLTEEEKRPSLEINRRTMLPTGFALTTSPRVADAALMSLEDDEELLFGTQRHDTDVGQRTMPEVSPPVMHPPVETGGCKSTKSAYADSTATGSLMREKLSVSGSYSNDAARDGARGMTWMGIRDRLAALFSRRGVQADTELLTDVAGVLSEGDPEETDERVEVLERRIALMAQAQREAEAERWADEMIGRERRLAYPAERSAMIALFCQAARDDEATPAMVVFSTGDGEQQTSRVEALKSAYLLREPHDLLRETVSEIHSGTLKVAALFNPMETPEHGKERSVTPARKDALLARTPEGRVVLAERNGSAG
jgi:hypothetical protein